MKRLSFDEYADTVREANLDFLMIDPNQAPWELSWREVGSILLQFGAEGSSNIRHGLSRPDGLLFIVQYEQFADRVIFDGQEVEPYEFASLSSSSHFSAVTFGPHRWMSISLPIGLFGKVAARNGRSDLEWVEREKWLISASPELVECLTKEAVNIAALLDGRAALGLDMPEGAETSFLNSLIDAVASARKKVSLADASAKPSRHIMHKALEYIRCHEWQVLYVNDLARAANVTDRTLRRSFNQQLAVGPTRYLKLRQLNIVRRALRGKLNKAGSVNSIMRQHGVTEFGRFAVEYKNLFGESPSETRKRLATR